MRIRRGILSFSSLLGLALLFAACKKDKEETEKLPVFGTCEPVTAKGHLSLASPAGPYTFKTSGGINIVIDPTTHMTITHDDYPAFKLELWGLSDITNRLCGNHESLNGKHVKDRSGTRRTILFPDGAKMTMFADGAYANPLLSISIYDGAESHYLNMTCLTLEYSSINAEIAQQLDNAEADGETATVEFSATGALFVNIYTENVAGDKVMNRVPLAELIWAEPSTVRDHYDDPRMGHT